MRVVKYQRVSTSKQDYENQTKALDKQIELLGWDCVGEYKEVVSGVKDTRPQLQKMIEDARLRKFDRVIVFALDRLGRKIVQVVNTIHSLEECGVHLFVVKESVDTSNSQGKIFANFISIFSQLERDMMISRQKEAIDRIRTNGGKWGKGKLISQEQRDRIVALRTQGLSYRGICKEVDVSLGSVQHTLKMQSIRV
ncbi:recombinase family protein [Candidatus Thioglobus sp.]|jgi:DNA invertase Pin-like site-specific DNA recombinase|nr:recombinase family protein [Candidatus Thioglobus sp.]